MAGVYVQSRIDDDRSAGERIHIRDARPLEEDVFQSFRQSRCVAKGREIEIIGKVLNEIQEIFVLTHRDVQLRQRTVTAQRGQSQGSRIKRKITDVGSVER